MLAFQRYLLAFALVTWLQTGYAFHAEIPDNLTPEQVTWLWGHHAIPGDITRTGTPYRYVYPHTDINRIDDPAWSEVAATHIKPGARAPAVLVLHSCGGLPVGTTEYRQYFIEAGYAVFEPDSFARPGPGPGARKCDRSSNKARVKELKHAVTEIKKLEWVDQEQVFLMGFGQGGKIVARWDGGGFAGHIILGANCWGSHRKATAHIPKSIPVLAVIGENDPYLNGPKCTVNSQIPGSKSIVIEGAGHFILDFPETGRAIHEFLTTVRKRSSNSNQ